MKFRFVFVGEGTSDQSLVEHLELLCVHCGAEEVSGTAPDLAALPVRVGNSVEEKLKAVLQLEPDVDLVFVQRDADRAGMEARIREICTAANSAECDKPIICVVPERALEAWLLLDEPTIRRVAENPGSTVELDLPQPNQVHKVSDPKAKLKQALLAASDYSGRRREKFKKHFNSKRRNLVHALDPTGLVSGTQSYRAVREAVEDFIG